MLTKIAAVFLLYMVSSIFAQPTCVNQTNCDACSLLDGCGWCAPIQKCLPGNVQGPINATCVGSAWEFGKCTPCETLTDCRDCRAHSTDCFWCQSGAGSCKSIGFGGCPWADSCPCDVYASCSECTSDSTCQWCSDVGLCIIQSPDTSCPSGPSFNYTSGCPCSLNSDCPGCRQTFGCQWCGEETPALCSERCNTLPARSCSMWCQQAATDCVSCVSTNGCAWCSDLQQCVDPSDSTCLFSHTCPNCGLNTFCDTCIQNADCVWCDDSASCQVKGQTSCFFAHTCDSYCASMTFCESCNQARGCAWCDSSSSCVDVTTSTCLFAHTCTSPTPPTSCGFRAGDFLGGMFLMLVLFLIAFAGLAFYRWRTGSRPAYTELK